MIFHGYADSTTTQSDILFMASLLFDSKVVDAKATL
jgi:hypothetical protein